MADQIGTTIKDRLAELEKVASDFENKLKLDKFTMPEVNLELRHQDLLKMTEQDIKGYCFDLGLYSINLQRELNMVNGRYHWAESVLKRYLAENSQNYKGFTYTERCDYCLVGDSYAQKMDDFKIKCKMIMDRNYGMTNKVEFLIKMASAIAYSKKDEKGDS